MGRKQLLWRLYPSYVVIIFVSLLLVAGYALTTVRTFHRELLADNLESQAILFGNRLAADGSFPGEPERVDRLCKELGGRIATRITVVLPDGRVIGDSDEDPGIMDNHGDRPEIRDAFRSGAALAERFSGTLRQDMMYVGWPLVVDGRVAAVVRTSVSTASIRAAMHSLFQQISVSALLALLAAALVGLVVSKRITHPLEVMRAGAARFAAGDLQYRLRAPDSVEMASLAEAMNAMAADLDNRIRAIVEARNTRDAVFASMVEGVLAVDSERRVVHVNATALRLLEWSEGIVRAEGRLVEEIVRSAELQRFVVDNLVDGGTHQADMSLGQVGTTFIRAQSAPLYDADGVRIGALIMLNDVTQVRRLEKVRRDFVANVSHELKTPITSIKGFVETLLDGAAAVPEDRARFLSIVLRQANHLNAIVNDLLALSRLEHEMDGPPVELEATTLAPVLRESIEVCQAKADDKALTLALQCEPALEARINVHLFEQAVVNLIDNAIKFSEPKSVVTVGGFGEGRFVRVFVRDTGIGIESRHQERLFERFYRVDKGRSRDVGGTGLGLAIVKHIARVHDAQVSVESAPGKGSIFTILLHAPSAG
jgi:two-component system, OmpR family, phosphate regulon sensor histidine kinase PhoR